MKQVIYRQGYYFKGNSLLHESILKHIKTATGYYHLARNYYYQDPAYRLIGLYRKIEKGNNQ